MTPIYKYKSDRHGNIIRVEINKTKKRDWKTINHNRKLRQERGEDEIPWNITEQQKKQRD